MEGLPEGTSEVGQAGRNDFEYDGYRGPCPPPNHPPHRYHWKLYALDLESLGVAPGALRRDVEAAMEGHILAEVELVGRFERRPGPVR